MSREFRSTKFGQGMSVASLFEPADAEPSDLISFVPYPTFQGSDSPLPLYIGQMICFCAERFQWRRIWQNPGEFPLSGLADMATRALLYRRPAEPSRLLVKHGSQIYS